MDEYETIEKKGGAAESSLENVHSIKDTQNKKHGKWCRFKHYLHIGKKHPKEIKPVSKEGTEKMGNRADDEFAGMGQAPAQPENPLSSNTDNEEEGRSGTMGRSGASTTRKPAGLPSIRVVPNAKGKEAIRAEQALHEQQMREHAKREPHDRAEEKKAIKRQMAAEKKRMKELKRECTRKAKEEKKLLKKNK